MKHILTMKSSKRTKLSYFQNFISRTFLDNLSLEKKSCRQFTFLCTPACGPHSSGKSDDQPIRTEQLGHYKTDSVQCSWTCVCLPVHWFVVVECTPVDFQAVGYTWLGSILESTQTSTSPLCGVSTVSGGPFSCIKVGRTKVMLWGSAKWHERV